MSFLYSLNTCQNALSAQRLRMDIISQNIANAETTRTQAGGPYRRQEVVFQERKSFKQILGDEQNKTRYEGVTVAAVKKDPTPLNPVYDPTHPDADENGYVKMPNVDRTKETLDLMAATNSYQSNLTALNAVKTMAQKALSIGR